MKKRISFVTNSSSSSYVCEVCGEEISGWDISLSDNEMAQCQCGHIFCLEHMPDEQREALDDCKIYENDCEVPFELCPICQMLEVSSYDEGRYVHAKLGMSEFQVKNEILATFKTHEELSDFLNASSKNAVIPETDQGIYGRDKEILDDVKNGRTSVCEFRGIYDFLSNFYPAETHFERLTYLNSEAAFQSAKTTSIQDRLRFTQMNPSVAKKEGRALAIRPYWDEMKDSVMEACVKSKFLENNYLRRALIATGKMELIEGNDWGDTYWGVCGKGENKLGKILMKVRDELAHY